MTSKILITVFILVVVIFSVAVIINNRRYMKMKQFQNQVVNSSQTFGENFAAQNAQFLVDFQNKSVDWEKIKNMSAEEKQKLLNEITNGIYINVPVL
jgi:hypothetical protein